MTLKRRFSLVFIGLTLAVLSLFSSAYYFLENRSSLRLQHKAEQQMLNKSAAVCRESILELNPVPVINYFNILKKDPEIFRAGCFDSEGRIQAHTEPELFGKFNSPASSSPNTEKFERSWGAVEIEFNREFIQNRIHKELLDVLVRILFVSGGVFVLVLLAAIYLAKTLTQPIDVLVHGAREIGRGNLEHQVAMTRREDELGFLAREFNAMSGRLKEVDELKDKFLQSITHDLKTPLTAIQGYAELMLDVIGESSRKEQEKNLSVIFNSSRLLASFIDDILDLTKFQAHRMEIKREPIEIPQFFSGIKELLAVTAEQKGVRISTQFSEGLSPVSADSKFLSRVFNNLLGNALKFTPRGGAITVSARTDRPGFTRISIKDNGAGIPDSKLTKVFDKFFQVSETKAKASHSGTGLGLAITKEIIEAHGGTIYVESSLGRGAEFIFTLENSN